MQCIPFSIVNGIAVYTFVYSFAYLMTNVMTLAQCLHPCLQNCGFVDENVDILLFVNPKVVQYPHENNTCKQITEKKRVTEAHNARIRDHE